MFDFYATVSNNLSGTNGAFRPYYPFYANFDNPLEFVRFDSQSSVPNGTFTIDDIADPTDLTDSRLTFLSVYDIESNTKTYPGLINFDTDFNGFGHASYNQWPLSTFAEFYPTFNIDIFYLLLSDESLYLVLTDEEVFPNRVTYENELAYFGTSNSIDDLYVSHPTMKAWNYYQTGGIGGGGPPIEVQTSNLILYNANTKTRIENNNKYRIDVSRHIVNVWKTNLANYNLDYWPDWIDKILDSDATYFYVFTLREKSVGIKTITETIENQGSSTYTLENFFSGSSYPAVKLYKDLNTNEEIVCTDISNSDIISPYRSYNLITMKTDFKQNLSDMLTGENDRGCLLTNNHFNVINTDYEDTVIKRLDLDTLEFSELPFPRKRLDIEYNTYVHRLIDPEGEYDNYYQIYSECEYGVIHEEYISTDSLGINRNRTLPFEPSNDIDTTFNPTNENMWANKCFILNPFGTNRGPDATLSVSALEANPDGLLINSYTNSIANNSIVRNFNDFWVVNDDGITQIPASEVYVDSGGISSKIGFVSVDPIIYIDNEFNLVSPGFGEISPLKNLERVTFYYDNEHLSGNFMSINHINGKKTFFNRDFEQLDTEFDISYCYTQTCSYGAYPYKNLLAASFVCDNITYATNLNVEQNREYFFERGGNTFSINKGNFTASFDVEHVPEECTFYIKDLNENSNSDRFVEFLRYIYSSLSNGVAKAVHIWKRPDVDTSIGTLVGLVSCYDETFDKYIPTCFPAEGGSVFIGFGSTRYSQEYSSLFNKMVVKIPINLQYSGSSRFVTIYIYLSI